MSLSAFLYSLASVPMFASRPFLAALVTSLLARYGTSIPWLEHSSVIQALHGAPEWFTSWITLSILGALTVLEWLSVKHSEVRAIMQELDSALKSAVAMLVCLAIIDKDTAGTVQSIHKAGLGFHSLFAGVVGLLTFGASNLRVDVRTARAPRRPRRSRIADTSAPHREQLDDRGVPRAGAVPTDR